MRFTKIILWAIMSGVLSTFAFGYDTDDTVPQIKSRVSRISYMNGEVQIKRNGSQDWEKAAQNLPLTEGDQVATGANSRTEIQFDSNNYLRLDENSYLKIVTLRDEGIALSLPNGTLALRVLNFNKDRVYFEIDAPKTTISIQQAGMFRVDSNDNQNQKQVRVTVTDNGQARVYSDNSGFTVKNGRSARLNIDGTLAGEWETSNASNYTDDFENWVLQRDAETAKRLQRASYDKYYDRDMYGAEDLEEYGEWIYTKKYGNVWRPYRNTTNSYADWSPYRYGNWRWVSPYGWTWVNDEPWGWATYHHGRWIYDEGNWCWTPYGSHRSSRSWWRPALVIITYSGSSICWYPLGYNSYYYDYNSYYWGRGRGRGGNTIINNTTIINNNTTVVVSPPPPSNVDTPPIAAQGSVNGKIPPTGVISMPKDQFGRGIGGIKRLPVDEANQVLKKQVSEKELGQVLPGYEDSVGSQKSTIARQPVGVIRQTQDETVQIGAAKRDTGTKLDETLRNERIYDNRKPVQRTDDNGEIKGAVGAEVETGAVSRPVRQSVDTQSDSTKPQNPVRRPSPKDDYPTTQTGNDSGGNTNRKPVERPSQEDVNTDRKPRYEPQRQPRNDSPPREEKPRYDPPPREEKPRNTPPPREEKPRNEPRPAPPQKVEQPREERKSQPAPAEVKDGKDNR
jgi:FecR protein